MLKRPCHGVIAAPFLPMHADGEIDWAGLERYMDWLANQNPAGIAMNMDASEVIALSEDEQDQVIRACIGVIRGVYPFFRVLLPARRAAPQPRPSALPGWGLKAFRCFHPSRPSRARQCPAR